MDRRTIVFRADSGPTIGMGHFMRTLALAEMLNEHFHCIFATRQPMEYQETEIKKICHEHIKLPEDNTHFELFLNHLKGDEIVVLDNYYFTTEYQKAIKAKGCKLVCIDDIHDKHYVADVVINHAEGIEHSSFSIEPYTKLLVGYKYALLRSDFRISRHKILEKKYSAIIIMGGADPFDITKKIITILKDVKFEKPVIIVSGKKLYGVDGINYNKQFVIVNNQSSSEIARLMQSAVFGIFPASTVAIEACAIRLPFICGYFIDNQREIYKGIEKKGLALCIGNFNNLHKKQLLYAISKINSQIHYDNIIKEQASVADNQSKDRLLKIFQQL